jgi:hypothetical protein
MSDFSTRELLAENNCITFKSKLVNIAGRLDVSDRETLPLGRERVANFVTEAFINSLTTDSSITFADRILLNFDGKGDQ